MWIVVGLGVLAWLVSSALWVPPARELVIKLGTLMDWARRQNPELYASRLAPITPFVSPKVFKMGKINKVLRADLSEFGEICQRLQREGKQLDRRAHVATLPMMLYAIGVGVWWFVLRA
jgi:hypothetical protein